jgi:IS5 family transposase
MIKYTSKDRVNNQLFKTPFQQDLDKRNRWVLLAHILPWDAMASVYMKYMSEGKGRQTIDLRIVMGAMYIQNMLNLTDRETIDAISENIYMQYFVGLSSFQTKPIFDHSLLSIFRHRLGKQGSSKLNEILVGYAFDIGALKHRKPRQSTKSENENIDPPKNKVQQTDESVKEQDERDDQDEQDAVQNKGTIKVDATVAPQDISYPTDTKLLNHGREISERIIDEMYEQCRSILLVKPRTYRREARKKWLSFSKKRKPNKRDINKQIKAQLGYLRRNLKHIDDMFALGQSNQIELKLKQELRRKMYVISELYRQQKKMYEDGRKKVSDRIVSIAQPWLRPIVRGKAGCPVEFGAKVNLSLTEGFLKADQISFDAYNEGKGLIKILESYKERFGYYPEYALVDKIYMNRENRTFMKAKGIKHTGAPLGRPKEVSKNEKLKRKKKNNERNHIEGKIGQSKRRFGLDNVRTKRAETTMCAINLMILAINMFSLIDKNLALYCDKIARTLSDILNRILQVVIQQNYGIPGCRQGSY